MPSEEIEATRRLLRSGILPIELLKGGHDVVLRSGDRHVTRDELRTEAEQVAGGLNELGVKPGDRVGMYAASSLDWVVAYLGAQRSGACVVPMNPDYRSAEVEHIVTNADPLLVITDDERTATVEGLGRRAVSVHRPPRGAPPPMPDLTPESPAAILYTSGTTGRPKGAVLDHGGLLAQARGAIAMWRWTSGDILVHGLPLFHLHGLGMGLHGTLLSGGSATLIHFSPQAVVAELTRRDEIRGTMFFGVPAMYQRLLDWLDEHPTDLTHVRLFVSGSAPLPPALFERCERLLGQPPVERYGITEGGIVISNPYDGPRQPGRVGIPFPGVEVKIGDKDEVLLKGGQVFKGYWRNESATKEAFTPDGFFMTGDVGEIGEDGTLAIRGRLKELIISGGFNVYPREVEIVLESHPAVFEVAVAGVPSEAWGEEVTAYVVPSKTQPLVAEELIAFARERLATYKCPRRVVVVESLPRNAMGKVERSRLTIP
ncbi:MAG TPA: AMP-binding protein [Candidatus Dormibacteraeota bacterium]|nr:AMP-binding protein [Candidatus Dormibacteraeota bacterium]